MAIVSNSGAMKVLDIARSHIHTFLPPDELITYVERARLVSGMPFAPFLHTSKTEDGFVTEELLAGAHPTLEQELDFDRIYLPLLYQIITAQAPTCVPLESYVSHLLEGITGPTSLFARLEPDRKRHLRVFLSAVAERMPTADVTLPLVLSHGDLHRKNVVVKSGEVRALDWMRSDQRSPLFDLYCLYLDPHLRKLGARDLEPHLVAAIDSLAVMVDKNAKDSHIFAPFLSQDPRWRWLFYLECTYMKLVHYDRDPQTCLADYLHELALYETFEMHLHSLGKAGLPTLDMSNSCQHVGEHSRRG